MCTAVHVLILLLFCVTPIFPSQAGKSPQVHGQPPSCGTEGEPASGYEGCSWARCRGWPEERRALGSDVEPGELLKGSMGPLNESQQDL
jgi:hypothetical protein